MVRNEGHELIWVHFFVSPGGLFPYLHIHYPEENTFNCASAAFTAVSLFPVPFSFKGIHCEERIARTEI